MMAMSASRPPHSCTKRFRMRRRISLSSAPPIGTIQPRSSPSATLLGHIAVLTPRAAPRRRVALDPTPCGRRGEAPGWRSEEHTSELQPLMRISYAVLCLKKNKIHTERPYLITISQTHPQHIPNHSPYYAAT